MAIVLIGLLIAVVISQKQIQTIFITPSPTIAPPPEPRSPSPQNLIIISNPIPNQLISSPLVIQGRARGNWFFEATAPVKLIDAAGRNLATGFITAQGDWMTTEFVSFSGELPFATPPTATGQLIMEKNNPSGLPENDQQVVIPVRFR